ncbi:hypothetical protein KY359_04525 [Candidatus Woesearchaeota archaeon]|nr:hypothetical protein [Candidatus Woesearchaeota archaeon]
MMLMENFRMDSDDKSSDLPLEIEVTALEGVGSVDFWSSAVRAEERGESEKALRLFVAGGHYDDAVSVAKVYGIEDYARHHCAEQGLKMMSAGTQGRAESLKEKILDALDTPPIEAQTRSVAVSYHGGGQRSEESGDFKTAIDCYIHAGSFDDAFRVAKEHDLLSFLKSDMMLLRLHYKDAANRADDLARLDTAFARIDEEKR